MRRKKKVKKLAVNDINKNNSIKISHTISKIQMNEKKYTIILTMFFLLLFCLIGFLSLRVNTKNAYKYLTDIKANSISSSSKTVLLSEDDIMNDKLGLKSELYNIKLLNDTQDDINYKIVLEEDLITKKTCKCENNLDTSSIHYTIDDKKTNVLNDGGVITTGFIESGENSNIKIRIWIDENKPFTGHYHGYLVAKKIDE